MASSKKTPQLTLDLSARAAPMAGIDEAGRGPLAGPVVAAAVIWPNAEDCEGLTDSKKLTELKRISLFEIIQVEASAIGVGIATVEEIDELNIRQATFLAMERAVKKLGTKPASALVDGNALPRLPCPADWVIGGDLLVPEISAASIIAKVTRDQIMTDLAAKHPGYGWETNKGYGTKDHLKALSELGATEHHRRSFAPVRKALAA